VDDVVEEVISESSEVCEEDQVKVTSLMKNLTIDEEPNVVPFKRCSVGDGRE